MKFKNIRVFNFEGAFRGMRNPHNSWNKSLSEFGIKPIIVFGATVQSLATKWLEAAHLNMLDPDYDTLYAKTVKDITQRSIIHTDGSYVEYAALCPDDLNLAHRLIMAGPEHRKFMRQIMVSVDITAPLYWWKEFDTYKVGTIANSTSTMHKLTSKPITLDCFEIDDYHSDVMHEIETGLNESAAKTIINICESLRQKYLETKDKKYWKELIRWLPESFLQTRTVTMNYENLYEMCLPTQRRYHKLTEWSKDFMKFARQLPYADVLLFGDEISK